MSGGARRVLMVSPSFFGYERAIADELTSRGASVTLVDDRPGNSSWVKAAARLAPGILRRRTRRHYREVLRRVADDVFDLVLVVKGEVVPTWFLESVRRQCPRAVFAYYTFDSCENSPRGLALLPFFDRAFSFDRADVARHAALTYKPLFSAAEFTPGAAPSVRPHDLCFVGTVHSDRYAVCRALAPAGSSHSFFFYSPARWHQALTSLLQPRSRRIPWHEVSFQKISRAEVAQRFRRSRAVIDVQRTGQSGLTMRTFEVLASGTRLVTANTAVREEAFFDPRWVYVLPADEAEWDLESLRRFVHDDTPLPPDLVGEHSLARWVDDFWELALSARTEAAGA